MFANRTYKRCVGENMINFIIVEDNSVFNNIIKNEIDKIMFPEDIEYHISTFLDFNDNFKKAMTSNMPSKIYILDIETPSASGIDIARKIRLVDTESIIIFLTSHDEFGDILLKDEIMFLAFIIKTEYRERLPKAIKIALQTLGNRKMIEFVDQKVKYTIPMNSILYVTTNTLKQKTVIVTNYSVFQINKSLRKVEKMLDHNFERCHRACIVNKKRIVAINKNLHVITFDNGQRTGLMNDKFKKKI